jgi:heme a synthase
MMLKSPKAVSVWLFIGVVMIFIQVIIGGITRLTGSGLSITKWEIVTGTLPPMNEAGWQNEFDLYKQTPQYQKINAGMTLTEFKFIYFWEYFHRLWARLMGIVFAIPFAFFWMKGMFSAQLKKRLIVVFLLAALVASFGWIMVASGLVNRPWVNAYKLSLHLCLALFLYGYLLWTALLHAFQGNTVETDKGTRKMYRFIMVLLAVQLFLGGVMSGMKAGLLYPTWPKMGDEWFPQLILNSMNWKMDEFMAYDRKPFASTLIHIMHRLVAYLLTVFILWFWWRIRNYDIPSFIKNSIPVAVILQIVLGIITVISSQSSIPLFWGVMHQAGAIILLTSLLSTIYFLRFNITAKHK